MNNKTIKLLVLLGMMFALALFQIKNVNAKNREGDSAVDAKIINGTKSKADAWPWMAYIENDLGGGWIGTCGGTLVAPQWVLTAAHCAEDMVSAKVFLDRNNLRGAGGDVISVSHSVVHPRYNPGRYISDSGFDIALLYLEKPSSIKPVTLANNFDFQLEEGGSAWAVGWGVTHEGDDNKPGDKDVSPRHLQEVELTIKRGSVCNNPYFPDNVICLGVYDKKIVCRGDSGGPLLLQDPKTQIWKQIGITSFGHVDGCTVEEAYAVFTQVDKYQSFIDSTINGTTLEETPEAFLAKCVKKFPDYLGEKVGKAFPCYGRGTCQNTTGGKLMDIKQIFVSRNNPGEILDFFENTGKQWHKASFSDIGYCE